MTPGFQPHETPSGGTAEPSRLLNLQSCVTMSLCTTEHKTPLSPNALSLLPRTGWVTPGRETTQPSQWREGTQFGPRFCFVSPCTSAERSALGPPLWNPGGWSRECAGRRGLSRAGHWSFCPDGTHMVSTHISLANRCGAENTQMLLKSLCTRLLSNTC